MYKIPYKFTPVATGINVVTGPNAVVVRDVPDDRTVTGVAGIVKPGPME